jgi:hypothetical protein
MDVQRTISKFCTVSTELHRPDETMERFEVVKNALVERHDRSCLRLQRTLPSRAFGELAPHRSISHVRLFTFVWRLGIKVEREIWYHAIAAYERGLSCVFNRVPNLPR